MSKRKIKINLRKPAAIDDFRTNRNLELSIWEKRKSNSEPIELLKSDLEHWFEIDDKRIFTPFLEDYEQDCFTIPFNKDLIKLTVQYGLNEWLTGQIAAASDCLFSLASSKLYFEQEHPMVKAYQRDLIQLKKFMESFDGLTPDYKYTPKLTTKIQKNNGTIKLESDLVNKKIMDFLYNLYLEECIIPEQKEKAILHRGKVYAFDFYHYRNAYAYHLYLLLKKNTELKDRRMYLIIGEIFYRSGIIIMDKKGESLELDSDELASNILDNIRKYEEYLN